MKSSFVILEPEVAGGWGPSSVVVRTPGRPVLIEKLHYRFDGWLGDELLESTPCFIATRRLVDEVQNAGLSGVDADAVEISKSSLFRELHPTTELPPFVWLRVHGEAGVDDFGLTHDLFLVVSSRAYAVIEKYVAHAIVEPFEQHRPKG